jgi:hypothetical protein
MKAIFASQLDCKSFFHKNEKVMLEGATYCCAASHLFLPSLVSWVDPNTKSTIGSELLAQSIPHCNLQPD